jgi:hypothetical protein
MSRQPITVLQFATRLADDAKRFAIGHERARAHVTGFPQKQSFAEWMKQLVIFVEKDDAKRTARSGDKTLIKKR